MNEPWFNLRDYTLNDHLTFGIGCFMWVIVYVLVIRDIRRYQFVEIPLMAIAINFAWEMLWSWVFRTDMGLAYVWGYRSWFLLDCFIVYHALKYGYKQLPEGIQKSKAPALLITAVLFWVVILYFFTKEFDLPVSHMGGFGGYWCNLLMSAVYIPLLWRVNKPEYFSLANAWLKGLGTGLVTVFCFFHFTSGPYDNFLYSLGIATAALDGYYIYQLFLLKRRGNVST